MFAESSGSGGETRETVVARLVNDMLDKLPEFYNAYEVLNRLKEMGILNPMVIFLRQEIDRMQKVTNIDTVLSFEVRNIIPSFRLESLDIGSGQVIFDQLAPCN